MEVVKVRRVGTSNVVTVPRVFEQFGYTPGTLVVVGQLPNGDLVLHRVDSAREAVRAIAAQVVAEDRQDLDFLAAYDRGDESAHEQLKA